MAKKEVRENILKINYMNLGFAGGILIGAIIFLMTLSGILFNLYPQMLSIISDAYGWLGYDVTPFGMVLGAIYGFIDGFIFFFLLGILYNRMR